MIGYGGGETLMVSADAGRTWEAGPPVQPASLAFSGPRVLATTQQGLMASTDGGRTFRAVKDAPLLVLVSAGTDRTVLGLDPQLRVWHSADAGRNWAKVGQAPRAQAIAAHENGTGFAIAEDTLYLIG